MTLDFPYKKMLSFSKVFEDCLKKNFLFVDVDIILGQPTQDCRHLGICKIKPEKKSTNPLNESPLAQIKASIFWYKKEDIIILFKKTSINQATQKIHFKKNYFTITETVSLPGFARDVLKNDFSFSPGDYPIYENESHFIVRFSSRILS